MIPKRSLRRDDVTIPTTRCPFLISVSQLGLDLTAPIELSIGALNLTADVSMLDSWLPVIPTYPTTVDIECYNPDFTMNLVAREIGNSTHAPAGYDLVGSSPLYPDGYTFERNDLILYSSLAVSDDPIYDLAASLAFGPGHQINVFGMETQLVNASGAATLGFERPRGGLSGGVDLDTMGGYAVMDASVDDYKLAKVLVSPTAVELTIADEDIVSAAMGGFVYLGGTDDGFSIELKQVNLT